MEGELNPNHPTTMAIRLEWHKLLVILMVKEGLDHVVISKEDVDALPEGICIVVQELSNGIHLRLVDEATAQQLAKENQA